MLGDDVDKETIAYWDGTAWWAWVGYRVDNAPKGKKCYWPDENGVIYTAGSDISPVTVLSWYGLASNTGKPSNPGGGFLKKREFDYRKCTGKYVRNSLVIDPQASNTQDAESVDKKL